MRIRQNKVPSFFNLSMVDVLCCALGCVIMLWLINHHQSNDSKRQAKADTEKSAALLDAAKEERTKNLRMLATTRLERDEAQMQLVILGERITELEQEKKQAEITVAVQSTAIDNLDEKVRDALARIALMQTELDTSKKSLADSTKDKVDLNAQIAKLVANIRSLETEAKVIPGLQKDLKVSKEELVLLKAQLTAQAKALAKQQKDLDARQIELEKAEKDLASTLASKRELESKLKTSTTNLVAKAEALDEAKGFRTKWLAAEKRILELEKTLTDKDKKLTAAIRQLLNSQRDAKELQTRVATLKSDAINRFAGITLSGKRVVFLVDRSGSMLESAEKQPSPAKWREVRNTVAKVMRSLPNLEKFQVIVFAENTIYPLGSKDDWIAYDPETSPDAVVKALSDKKLSPYGGTNMYSALEAAFGLRSKGLDNIYILSDGLPSLGPGVSPDILRTLPEIQKGQRLGSHIRNKLALDWNRPVDGERPVRINAIGFFYESPDVGAFLWALSRENRGSFVGMNH